jgi:hypothetical protein
MKKKVLGSVFALLLLTSCGTFNITSSYSSSTASPDTTFDLTLSVCDVTGKNFPAIPDLVVDISYVAHLRAAAGEKKAIYSDLAFIYDKTALSISPIDGTTDSQGDFYFSLLSLRAQEQGSLTVTCFNRDVSFPYHSSAETIAGQCLLTAEGEYFLEGVSTSFANSADFSDFLAKHAELAKKFSTTPLATAWANGGSLLLIDLTYDGSLSGPEYLFSFLADGKLFSAFRAKRTADPEGTLFHKIFAIGIPAGYSTFQFANYFSLK